MAQPDDEEEAILIKDLDTGEMARASLWRKAVHAGMAMFSADHNRRTRAEDGQMPGTHAGSAPRSPSRRAYHAKQLFAMSPRLCLARDVPCRM